MTLERLRPSFSLTGTLIGIVLRWPVYRQDPHDASPRLYLKSKFD
jgi:hypothetical protein